MQLIAPIPLGAGGKQNGSFPLSPKPKPKLQAPIICQTTTFYFYFFLFHDTKKELKEKRFIKNYMRIHLKILGGHIFAHLNKIFSSFYFINQSLTSIAVNNYLYASKNFRSFYFIFQLYTDNSSKQLLICLYQLFSLAILYDLALLLISFSSSSSPPTSSTSCMPHLIIDINKK